LTYTVHFQNTGNSEAINIYILDTLDPLLDISTIHVISQSHPIWTELIPGNILKFHFDDIHLADSTSNEPESHGFVIFEVKPLTGSGQETIHNMAGIYFDHNPVVITNSVFNTLFSGDLEAHICNMGILGGNTEYVKVFPNPFANGFTISREKDEAVQITLFDLQGKIVVASFTSSEKMINISGDQLENGIYLLRILTDHSETIVKIVKS